MAVQGPNTQYDVGATYAPSVRPTTPVDHHIPGKASGGDPPAPVATVTISPQAQALGKLQRLQEDAPATFKAVVGHMADAAAAAADKADGDHKKELAKLSQKLNEAAKSGDLSVFKPTHHHHRVHAASSTTSAPSMLQSLLDQIDHVLGPDASSPTEG